MIDLKLKKQLNISHKDLKNQSIRPIKVMFFSLSGVTLINSQLKREIKHLEGQDVLTKYLGSWHLRKICAFM